jgi:hypothetical protein
MGLENIELGDVAAACAAMAVYMDKCVGGRGSRPPLGKSVYVWLAKKLPAIDSFGGRWTLREDWRKIWISNGLDPATHQVGDEYLFERAVRKWTVRKERLVQIKKERRVKRNGEAAGSESNGESGSTPEVLTPVAAPEPDRAAPMLRAIQRKLGPKWVTAKPLDWNLIKAPEPIPAIIPAPRTGSMWDENYQLPPGKPSEKLPPAEPDQGEIEATGAITARKPEAEPVATSTAHLEAIAARNQAASDELWYRSPFSRGP